MILLLNNRIRKRNAEIHEVLLVYHLAVEIHEVLLVYHLAVDSWAIQSCTSLLLSFIDRDSQRLHALYQYAFLKAACQCAFLIRKRWQTTEAIICWHGHDTWKRKGSRPLSFSILSEKTVLTEPPLLMLLERRPSVGTGRQHQAMEES